MPRRSIGSTTDVLQHGLMGWDASRPVPYRRLFKEWLIYAAIMGVLFALFMRDSTSAGGLGAGLAASLPLYLGISYVLAKFGYQRKTLAEMRTPRATRTATSSPSGAGAASARVRPAPTRRTASGNGRPARKRR